MESNNKLKEIATKNRTCYYFDGIININDLDLDTVLLDEKSFENILIYDVAYKVSYDAKSLRIIFDKVDTCIRKYDRTNCLLLFHAENMREYLMELDVLLC